MNGRMYDPVIGRVLSPDIVIQNPGNTQSYNRYSYCMNNPLRYTDPSGWYMATGTSFGRDIIELRGTTFYDYGVGSPGNFYSGGGSNTSIGPQGYRYVGGGAYMDVATGEGVDFGTVYDNSLAQEQVGFSSGSVAREFVDRIKSGFGLFSYQLYNRINWVLSIGNPGLYAAIGGGYKTLNPTAGSFTFGGEITNVTSENMNGIIVSVANGAAALGPIGIMGDLGFVSDSYGNASLYLTLGGVGGGGASAGMGVARTSKHFNIADFGGSSQGFMGQIFGVSYEVFGNSSDTRGMAGIGDKYSGAGINLGVGAMAGYYYSYTLLFSPPSPDFWIRPGRR
jgi:hypothetical protein